MTEQPPRGSAPRGWGQQIPAETLRDAATSDAVERIWSRLDGNLAPRDVRPAKSSALALGLVASGFTFVLGVVVGGRVSEPEPQRDLAVRAEPKPDLGAASRAEPRRDMRAPLGDVAESPVRNRGVRTSRHGSGQPVPSGVLPEAALEEAVVPETVVETPAESVDPSLSPRAAEGTPTWQRLANAGEYEAALFELGQQGGFEGVLLDSSPEQLMLLADVARATGQTQRALGALRRIVTEFRSDPVAPLAAFSLGNLLEKSGDARGAAQAFAVYRALSPEGDFAEDALVREVRNAVERGDREVAEQLAAQYAAGFPEGRRQEEIQRWLEELAERERLALDAGTESESSNEHAAKVEAADSESASKSETSKPEGAQKPEPKPEESRRDPAAPTEAPAED